MRFHFDEPTLCYVKPLIYRWLSLPLRAVEQSLPIFYDGNWVDIIRSVRPRQRIDSKLKFTQTLVRTNGEYQLFFLLLIKQR